MYNWNNTFKVWQKIKNCWWRRKNNEENNNNNNNNSDSNDEDNNNINNSGSNSKYNYKEGNFNNKEQIITQISAISLLIKKETVNTVIEDNESDTSSEGIEENNNKKNHVNPATSIHHIIEN